MQYLFLNSYFKAIEKHIADQVDFDRMINCENAKQAFEVLQDTDYNKWALETKDLREIFKKEKIFFRKELFKLGVGQLSELFFLKADITNLRIYLKNKLFNLQSGQLVDWGKKEKELKESFSAEIEEAKSKETPALLDDYLTEIYLEKLKEIVGKDKQIKKFIDKYELILNDYQGEIRAKKIRKLEDQFISSEERKNTGLSSILAFFMKKWRAEKMIKTIIDGKRIGFSPQEIKNLTEDLRAL